MIKPRSFIINFIAVAISIFISILLVECILRVFYAPVKKEIITHLRSDKNYEKHEILGWIPKKSITGTHIEKGSFETIFKTNSRGLRDKEYTLEKPNDVVRVVVTGDSFTWGYGVNDHDVFTEVLEGMMSDVEVINLGVTAFGLRQELSYLKLEGLEYDPDVVIVAFCLNDILESIQTKGYSVDSHQNEYLMTNVNRDSHFLQIKKFFRRNLVLYQFAIERINTNRELVRLLVKAGLKSELSGFDELDTNLAPALKSYPKNLKDAFEVTKLQIIEISNFLEKKRIRFILALIPSLQTIDKKAFEHSFAYSIYDEEDFDLLKPYRLLEEFCKENDIEMINPVYAFRREYVAGKKLFLNNDMHFNKWGHELFAQEIFIFLKRHSRNITGLSYMLLSKTK